jgi:hypothetical protein
MESLPTSMETVLQVPILTMTITDQPIHQKDIHVINVIEIDTVHQTFELSAMKTSMKESLVPREDVHLAC